MHFVRLSPTDKGTHFDPRPYLAALPALAEHLPEGARQFATDPDHYNFYSERCVKDLKLMGLSYLDRRFSLSVEAKFWFNEHREVDELAIHYRAVRSVVIETKDEKPIGPTRLGDLMLDEILPYDLGVSHELEPITPALVTSSYSTAERSR